MKILLTDIVGKSEQYRLVELPDSPRYDFRLEGPVEATLLVRQKSEVTYLLSGALQASATAKCDRCGKKVTLTIDKDFRYTLHIGEESEGDAEHQCSDEDCETLHLDEAAIESDAIITEQLLLAIPLQRLCDETCKGLCRECGIDLNEKKCKCGESNSNSPFAILKKLQQK